MAGKKKQSPTKPKVSKPKVSKPIASHKIDSHDSYDDILTKIITRIDSMAKDQKELAKEQKELSKSQQFLSDNYDKIVEEMKHHVETNSKLKQEVSTLSRKYALLSSTIENMKTNANEQEQTKIGLNVVVRGINGNENAGEANSNIAKIIDVGLSADDIASAKQVHKEGKDSSILVKFNTFGKKKEFVTAAKKKRISTNTYGYRGG